MKNDYVRNNFAEVTRNNEKLYYLRVGQEWIQVSKEVFRVCKNSYLKIYREIANDKEHVDYYDNIDFAHAHIINKNNPDYVELITLSNSYQQLHKALEILTQEENELIVQLFFLDKTERELADEWHTSQQMIHYNKKKILKKLKKLLSK